MKKLIAMLLCVATLLSLSACVFIPTPSVDVEKEGDTQPTKNFTVVVVHQDGTEKTFTYQTTEKYVGPVLQADGLIEGNAGPYGLEITKVDGQKAIYAEDKAYWAVYEGEEYALQGIDTTPVVEGGVYKLVYTLG